MANLKLQVLVSTMGRRDLSLADKMNITTDALIINQINENIPAMYNEKRRITMLSYNERGLSKSRNKAIANSDADICLIADDDVVYNKDFMAQIIKAYEENPQYDIITFAVPSVNVSRAKKYYTERKEIGFIRSMKIASVEISFKRESIIKKQLRFMEEFGAGTQYSGVGEDSIFICDCLKNGLKILYLPIEIGVVTQESSTWFNGYDSTFFFHKGIAFGVMFGALANIFAFQFAVRKRHLYKDNMNFVAAFSAMLHGIKYFKEHLKK